MTSQLDPTAAAGRSADSPRFTAPPPPATFAGRSTELSQISDLLRTGGDAATCVALQGRGGVGKTTLALRLGRDLLDEFPAGVLWLPIGHENRPEDLVDRLALPLNLDFDEQPHLAQRTPVIQAELAARGRLLVILDDLWDADLGRWLLSDVLPADRALLVTSRDLAVSQALCQHVQRLDTLPEHEALDLLANILGPLDEQNEAAKALINLLEGLPLALELAARLCDNGAADLPGLAGRLQNKPALTILQLDEQERGESSVEACLALSYGGLDEDLQRRFRALGVFAAAPFDLAGLAAVWGDDDLDQAGEHARQLQRRGLLRRDEERLPALDYALEFPVYGQHSLLRAYALALLQAAGEQDGPAGRHAAYYQAVTGEAWQMGELFWDQLDHAWLWCAGQPVDTQLAYLRSLEDFLHIGGRWQPFQEMTTQILSRLPAEHLRPQDRGRTLHNLGFIADAVGDKQQALDYYYQALPLRRQTGDHAGEADTLNNIGFVYAALGEKQQALDTYNQALPLRREAGDRAGEADTLYNIGFLYSALEDNQQALDAYNLALPIYRQLEDGAGEAKILNRIGRVYSSLGEMQRALDTYNEALPIYRQVGDTTGEAIILTNIGAVYDALGEKQQALACFNQVLPLARQVGNRAGEAYTLNNIGLATYALGEKQQALDYFNQALSLHRQVGDRAGEAIALNNIGGVYEALGEKQEALAYCNQALLIYRQVGDRAEEAETLYIIGSMYDALGETKRALACFKRASRLKGQIGDHAGEATTLTRIGILNYALGRKKLALACYKRALPLSRQAGHLTGEATILTGIGAVYSALGNQQKAIAYYRQVPPLQREVGDRAGEADALRRIGQAYHALGKNQQALDYYEQALPLFRKVGDRAGEADILHLIGLTHSSLGEPQQALDDYNQALSIQRQMGSLADEAVTLNNIGLVYHYLGEQHQVLGNYNQALAYYNQALAYYNLAVPMYVRLGDDAGEGVTQHNKDMVIEALGALDKSEEQMQ